MEFKSREAKRYYYKSIKKLKRKSNWITIKWLFSLLILLFIIVLIPTVAELFLDTEGSLFGYVIHTFLFLMIGYFYLILRMFYLGEGIIEMSRITGMPANKWLEDVRKTDHLSTHLLSILKKDTPQLSDLENMQLLQLRIMQYCLEKPGNIYNNLLLLRAYYSTSISNNNRPLMISLFGFGVLMLAFIAQQILIGERFEIYGIELSFIYLVGMGLFFLVNFYNLDLGEKKRVALIYNVINEYIQELDNKEKDKPN